MVPVLYSNHYRDVYQPQNATKGISEVLILRITSVLEKETWPSLAQFYLLCLTSENDNDIPQLKSPWEQTFSLMTRIYMYDFLRNSVRISSIGL